MNFTVIDTKTGEYPDLCKDCPSCGWHWEGKPEPIEYKPFEENVLEALYEAT